MIHLTNKHFPEMDACILDLRMAFLVHLNWFFCLVKKAEIWMSLNI